MRKIKTLIAVCLAALQVFAGTGCYANTTEPQDKVAAVQFDEVDLSAETIAKYQFLESTLKEADAIREKVEKSNREQSTDEQISYAPPHVYIANLSINGNEFIVSALKGGQPDIYCTNSGCSYAFYKADGNTNKRIGSLSLTPPVYKVSCDKGDYVVVGTGSGIINEPFAVWVVTSNEMKHLRNVTEVTAEAICNRILKHKET